MKKRKVIDFNIIPSISTLPNNTDIDEIYRYINDNFGKSEIQDFNVLIDDIIRKELSDFRPFEKLSISEKTKVLGQFIPESIVSTINGLEEFLFYFIKIPMNRITKSHWENFEHKPNMSDSDIRYHVNKIIKLENRILKQGFDDKQPILLELNKELEYKVNGGHHRIQAVRNLIKAGVYSDDFQIPCLIYIDKKTYRQFIFYKKIEFEHIFDYSFLLDSIIIDKSEFISFSAYFKYWFDFEDELKLTIQIDDRNRFFIIIPIIELHTIEEDYIDFREKFIEAILLIHTLTQRKNIRLIGRYRTYQKQIRVKELWKEVLDFKLIASIEEVSEYDFEKFPYLELDDLSVKFLNKIE